LPCSDPKFTIDIQQGNPYAQIFKKGILIKTYKSQKSNKKRRNNEMKSARFIILSVVLVSTLVAWSTLAAAQAQWKVVVPQTLFAEKLRIAAFLDENFGLNGGAGDIGKARYTSDGGKTWAQSDSSGG
jgi:hypothetical protein